MVIGYGAQTSLLMTVISIVVSILLVASLMLPKKIHFGFNGFVLLLMGILPILARQGIIGFDPSTLPIVKYALLFIIVVAGRELIKEGIKEQHSYLKYPSIVLGIVIIILTTIPALYDLGAVSFTIPPYPQIINNVLYIFSGIFLIIGIFALGKEGL